MEYFDSDGCQIAWEEAGTGPPIVLVHGFAASAELNWKRPGWYDVLTEAGRRVVALDCRGHGQSDASDKPAFYSGTVMPMDVVRLMDHTGIEQADLMGYSMGAGIATWLLARRGERFRRVILAGAGGGALEGTRTDRSAVANELAAPEGSSNASPLARGFRAFAERGGGNLAALAAIMRSKRPAPHREGLARVSHPVLVVVGEDDDLVGDPAPLAEAIPGARLVRCPGNHLTAVGQQAYKDAVLEFLTG